MKKIKLILNESLITNTNTNSNQIDVIEDVTTQQKPDYQIIDVTIIPDEEYNPTIQSILIDLDESNRLCESEEESKNLSINILSETVNIKTGYSNSLFEFENQNHTITLSLVLQEADKKGIYKVEAYTTKGEKVFESNTCRPRKLIESYLNSLANEYLIDKKLKEEEFFKSSDLYTKIDDEKITRSREDIQRRIEEIDREIENKVKRYSSAQKQYHGDNALSNRLEGEIDSLSVEKEKLQAMLNESDLKEDAIDNARADTAMGGVAYDDYITNFRPSLRQDEDTESYSTEDFIKASELTDEIKNLNIDYSEWNNMTQEERDKLVTPELNRFYNKYKVDFEKNPDLFDLIQYNLTDDNFHTEARILRDLKGGE